MTDSASSPMAVVGQAVSLAVAVLIGQSSPTFAADSDSSAPQVDSVFIRLLDEVKVPAVEAGVITGMNTRRGDIVEASDPLAKLDDTAANLALADAKLKLAKARHRAANNLRIELTGKALQAAEVELERGRQSNRRVTRSVSRSELDRLTLAVESTALEHEQARRDYDEAQLDLRSAENDLASAKNVLRRRLILSPLSGMVVDVNHRQGEWIEPGQTLLRIVRLDRVRAEGLISADSQPAELLGRTVKVTAWVGDQKIGAAGKVVFVSPEIDPVSNKARIVAEVENRDQQLRPGMRAAMTIVP